MAGRPLRFLALTGVGWTAIRVVALWPSIDSGQALINAVVPPALAEADASVGVPVVRAIPPRVSRIALQGKHPPSPAGVNSKPDPQPVTVALATASSVSVTVRDDRAAPTIVPPLVPTPLSSASRLSGSAWLIAREGSERTLLGGQLGASQAGVRLLYALDEGRRLSLAARVATPLSGRGREAAIGVEWRPTRLPLRLVAEQRIALDGGRGGPSVLAIGGIGPTRVAVGFDVEAYGQAGGIARDRLEGFADGAARLARPVLSIGQARLDLGAGAWGGAQRGASRLDIGPTIGARVPVAKRTLRLTLDWRERIAGRASPGSGPALSIGSDF